MKWAFNHRTSTPANEEFVYDDLGNRLTLKVDGSVDTTYSHNSANEYTHINSGTANVTHDAAGNLSADQDGYSYHYDHDNRLTKIRKSGDTVDVATYTYDALGRRIEFIDEVAAVTTRYYYDGWRVLTETDGSDTVQRDFIYGNYIDEVLVMNDGTDDHYYAHDHLFSVVALLDDAGAVEEYYEYDAYGKVDVITNPGSGTWWDGDETHAVKSAQGNPYTFTGRRLDSLDNDAKPLMYYRNRYYDTQMGRFIHRDPRGYIDGLNMYAGYFAMYVSIDPFGLKVKNLNCGDSGGSVSTAGCCCRGKIFNPKTHCCENGVVSRRKPIWFIRRLNPGGFDHADVLSDNTLSGFFTDNEIHTYNPQKDGEDNWYRRKRPSYVDSEEAKRRNRKVQACKVFVCASQANAFNGALDRKKKDPDLDWTNTYNCSSLLNECAYSADMTSALELPGNDWNGPANLIKELDRQHPGELTCVDGYFDLVNGEPVVYPQNKDGRNQKPFKLNDI